MYKADNLLCTGFTSLHFKNGEIHRYLPLSTVYRTNVSNSSIISIVIFPYCYFIYSLYIYNHNSILIVPSMAVGVGLFQHFMCTSPHVLRPC